MQGQVSSNLQRFSQLLLTEREQLWYGCDTDRDSTQCRLPPNTTCSKLQSALCPGGGLQPRKPHQRIYI